MVKREPRDPSRDDERLLQLQRQGRAGQGRAATGVTAPLRHNPVHWKSWEREKMRMADDEDEDVDGTVVSMLGSSNVPLSECCLCSLEGHCSCRVLEVETRPAGR